VTTALREDLTCKELVELVTDYLEDRLSAEERLRFEEHLNWCPPCGQYLEQIHLTMRATGRLAEDNVSEPAKQVLLTAFRSWKGHQR
jgi:anti-sigma factor RsiW